MSVWIDLAECHYCGMKHIMKDAGATNKLKGRRKNVKNGRTAANQFSDWLTNKKKITKLNYCHCKCFNSLCCLLLCRSFSWPIPFSYFLVSLFYFISPLACQYFSHISFLCQYNNIKITVSYSHAGRKKKKR